jgi:hypothetical protein
MLQGRWRKRQAMAGGAVGGLTETLAQNLDSLGMGV